MYLKNLLKKAPLLLALFINANVLIGQQSFEKITDLASLTDGEYLIVYEENATSAKAMGKYNNSGFFAPPTDVTISSNKIESSETAIVWTFTGTGTANQFTISRDDTGTKKYVEYHGSGNRAYFVATNTDGKTKWDISIKSGKFVVTNNATTNRTLQYNSGSPRFACYKGSQNDLLLYKKTNTAPQATFTPANEAQNILVDVKPSIKFDEKIYKSGGTEEITDTDLSSLIVFKENNATGSDVDATLTYDNSTLTITVSPSASLKNNTTYYLAYGAVYDNENAENTGENITFTTKSATQSAENDILTFEHDNLTEFEIHNANHTVTGTVEYGTDISNLKPIFTVSPFASIADTTTAKDFSTPQTYTVTAENGTTQDWTVTIKVEEVTLFTKITDLTSLTDGEYLIVYEENATNAKAMGEFSSNIFLPTNAAINSNKIGSSETAIVWTFTGTGTANQFTISRDDTGIKKYVEYHGSGNNAYFVTTNTDGKTKWDISIKSGKFVVTNNATTNRILKYNSSSPRFACYKSGQKDLSLYKKDGTATNTGPQATFTPANEAQNILVDVKPSIKFDEKIYKSGGTEEIKDADLSSLIVFKENNATGSDVDATLTYDNSTFTITVSPSASLKNSTTYYLAYGAVYDNENAENTGENITFTTKSATLSAENDILTFELDNLTEFEIHNANHTVTGTVEYGTDISNLKPIFTVSPFASIADTTTAKDFSTPQTYTVTAENGTTQDWTVTITVAEASSKNDILTFDVTNLIEKTISTSAHTVVATVEYGTDISNLKPIFTVSPLASIADTTTAKDFSTPQTYTVTAENGTTQDWTVTISEKQPQEYTINDLVANNWAVDKEVKITGIVVATEAWSDEYNNQSLYIQDGTKEKSGIYIFRAKTKVTLGDKVTVVGKTSEYKGLRQIKPEQINIDANNQTLPDAVKITIPQAMQDNYQSMLVKVEKVSVARTIETGSYLLAEGTDSLPVYKKLYADLSLAEGKEYNITGILSSFNSKSQLYPRTAEDITKISGIQKPEIANVSFSPTQPTSKDNVSVSAKITNAEKAQLFWGTEDGKESNEVEFKKDAEVYKGMIPKSDKPKIYFKILAISSNADTVIHKAHYSITTGVDFEKTIQFRLFPNPSDGIFTIEMQTKQTNMLQIQILSICGKTVLNKTYSQQGYFKKQIDLSDQNKGVYIIKISTKEGIKVSKLIVE